MVSKFFALSLLASAVSAHMKMASPQPYGSSSLNNGPLDLSGSDFPCKQRPGVYELDGASNVYKQGSTQQLSFVGSAVHGGGSCQVSVTKDAQPDKNSVWKVIKSIEGGCPAKSQTGNMGDNAAASDPYTYSYTVPAELASGNYTIAWTWFNKIGNREMYMNCGPLTVTGDGGSDSFLDSLPDMFTANIFGADGCETVDSTDLEFPDPGKDVDRFNGATSAFSPPNTKCTAQAGSGGAAPTSAAGAGSAPAPTSAPAAPAPSGNDGGAPGGVFITAPGSAGAAPPAATQPAASEPAASPSAAAPTPPPAVTPFTTAGSAPAATSVAPAPAPAPSSGGSGSGSAPPPAPAAGGAGGFASGTACTDEGQWNCVGGASFQRCASGAWSPMIPLAAGMKCSPGQSDTLNFEQKKTKRTLRRAVRAEH